METQKRVITIHRPHEGEKNMNGILSIIRNALLLLGGLLAQNGWFTEAEWQQIVGAILVVGVAVWKWWLARNRNK